MMAFDHVFREVAERDSRGIHAVGPTGEPATFVFREFYCTDRGCDCRRVVLHMLWVEGKRVAASINYAFEPSRRRGEPQIFLDPLNPQSEHSESLLELFTEVIANDRAFRERLHRHYAMWKQVVDDPGHPEHAKVRPASGRPAPPRRKGAARQARGPARRGPAPARSIELVVARAARAEGKLQQRFRRLLGTVERLRQRMRAWTEQRPDIARELAAHDALVEQQRRLGRDMVSVLDRAYTSERLSKADRKKLAAVIASFAGELIERGGHDDLKAIYNRYSRSDFDAEVAAADAAGTEALKSMMELFGIELGDADIGSIDELRAVTEEKLRAFEEEEVARQEQRAKRKKSAKQLASEARRASEQRSAEKAMQDVYRTLAKALHPDRELDAGERARKAELMREVNVAYEASDLLRLLELQLQLEHVDATRVESLPDERVRHFNRILDEQSRQLAVELDDLELPFRLELGLELSAALTPADVIAAIRADSEAVQRRIASIARDLKAFEDVGRIKSWLKTRSGSRRRGDELEVDLFE